MAIERPKCAADDLLDALLDALPEDKARRIHNAIGKRLSEIDSDLRQAIDGSGIYDPHW